MGAGVSGVGDGALCLVFKVALRLSGTGVR